MDQAQQLRNVIKSQNQKKLPKARVITITSGKGGVGKSNLAVNLAIQLRKSGKRVIIFDADIGLANIEVMFGSLPKYNLGDLIYKGKELKEIISMGPMDIGFISGGSGIVNLHELSKSQLDLVLDNLTELEELADVLIIDTGAGISDSVMRFVVKSPEVILVTTPEPSSITDSYSLLKVLFKDERFNGVETRVNLVANKVMSLDDGQVLYDKLNAVVTKFLGGELNYLGMVPFDMALEKSVRQQKIVSIQTPTSNAARAFEILTSNLLKDEHNISTIKQGISQLFSNFYNRKV